MYTAKEQYYSKAKGNVPASFAFIAFSRNNSVSIMTKRTLIWQSNENLTTAAIICLISAKSLRVIVSLNGGFYLIKWCHITKIFIIDIDLWGSDLWDPHQSWETRGCSANLAPCPFFKFSQRPQFRDLRLALFIWKGQCCSSLHSTWPMPHCAEEK